MESVTLSIPNIRCGHCVMAIRRELEALPGVRQVEGDPAKKQILVRFEPPASLEGIKSRLTAAQYPASA